MVCKALSTITVTRAAAEPDLPVCLHCGRELVRLDTGRIACLSGLPHKNKLVKEAEDLLPEVVTAKAGPRLMPHPAWAAWLRKHGPKKTPQKKDPLQLAWQRWERENKKNWQTSNRKGVRFARWIGPVVGRVVSSATVSAPAPVPEPPPVVSRVAAYKGKTYRLEFLGDTKAGRRAKLSYRDGSKVFWVNADEVREVGTMPEPSKAPPAPEVSSVPTIAVNHRRAETVAAAVKAAVRTRTTRTPAVKPPAPRRPKLTGPLPRFYCHL